MTTLEIIKTTLSNMGEDTDSASVDEFSKDILLYVNDAVRMLSLKYPVVTEAAMESVNGFIPFTDFSKKVIKILCICNHEERKMFFEIRTEGIYIKGGKDEEYRISYTTPVKPLTSLSDVPKLPRYTHNALADYATYRMLIRGGGESQGKSQAYYADFMAVCNEGNVAAGSIINKY